jgi:hypothetical protein
MKRYIILYADGSMMFFTIKPDMEELQPQHRLFEVEGSVDIATLCDWIARMYQRKQFKEIVNPKEQLRRA